MRHASLQPGCLSLLHESGLCDSSSLVSLRLHLTGPMRELCETLFFGLMPLAEDVGAFATALGQCLQAVGGPDRLFRLLTTCTLSAQLGIVGLHTADELILLRGPCEQLVHILVPHRRHLLPVRLHVSEASSSSSRRREPMARSTDLVRLQVGDEGLLFGELFFNDSSRPAAASMSVKREH